MNDFDLEADKGARIGFVVLAHDNIFRLRQVLNSLANQNVPIAIHLDKKTPKHAKEALAYFLRRYKSIYWAKSIYCEWGEWSIVEAQIKTTKLLLKNEPNLDYVYHISGSCLPLRPVSELSAFLSEQDEQYDYIESVEMAGEKWVVDGLSMERVELYHPFNWRTQRRLFDANVKFQRATKYKRKIPADITPSFGSQWWCLSVPTIEKIFSDEKFNEYKKFFSKSWIPDESFFQTLARKHSPHIESRSLTYATFDSAGKPFLVYDDHIDILERLDAFFIRKIWRGADELYSHFLNPNRKPLKRDPYAKSELEALHVYAKETYDKGRPGLIAQFSRPPRKAHQISRNDYYVYVGFTNMEDQIYKHYFESDEIAQMGYLFHPNRTELTLSKHMTPRNMPDLFLLRDYHKVQFLIQRIWNAHPRKIAFMAQAHHLRKLTSQIRRDPHAHVVMIKGAWLLDIYERNVGNINRLRNICRVKMRHEENVLSAFDKAKHDNIHVVTLGRFLAYPESAGDHFPEKMEFSKPNIDYDQLKEFTKRIAANGINLRDYDLEYIFDSEEEFPDDGDTTIIELKKYANTRKL